MLLFGGKATSTIKVGSKTACGFLKCWAGVGSLGRTPEETLSLLCTYRYMYLDDALHCIGPGQRLASAVYVGHRVTIPNTSLRTMPSSPDHQIYEV